MDMILQLKRFEFSIAQMQEILSLIRLSNLTAEDDIADLINILEKKNAELKTTIARLEQASLDLTYYIKSVKKGRNTFSAEPVKKGIPITMLSLLCCPDCGQNLSLQNADIQNGQVIRAEATCPCGYHAVIQNGILITEGGKISQLDSPDIDHKFYKDLPVSWVTLFQRAFNWMLARYASLDLSGKVVMENHVNCYFFLFARLSNLQKNANYIIIDKYPEIVSLFKDMIERQNPDLNILYIADSTFQYPLKKGCVDLYVDFCSLNEYAIFNHEKNLFEIIVPYLAQNAEALGTYFYFLPNSPSQKKLLREYPGGAEDNYQFSHFLEAAQKINLSINKAEEIGSVTDWGGKNRNFTFHVPDDPMFLYAYHCKQKPQRQACR